MKTIYMNGMPKEESHILRDNSLFYIQELSQDTPDR